MCFFYVASAVRWQVLCVPSSSLMLLWLLFCCRNNGLIKIQTPTVHYDKSPHVVASSRCSSQCDRAGPESSPQPIISNWLATKPTHMFLCMCLFFRIITITSSEITDATKNVIDRSSNITNWARWPKRKRIAAHGRIGNSFMTDHILPYLI